jgi:hypothetical protein
MKLEWRRKKYNSLVGGVNYEFQRLQIGALALPETNLKTVAVKTESRIVTGLDPYKVIMAFADFRVSDLNFDRVNETLDLVLSWPSKVKLK